MSSRRDDEDMTGLPLYPKATDDSLKVAKWKDEFTDFVMAKGYGHVLRTGEKPCHPLAFEEKLLDKDPQVRENAWTIKRRYDKEADGQLFGWILRALKPNAPTLYKKIRSDVSIYDPTDAQLAAGRGHLAWRVILATRAFENMSTEESIVAVQARDDFAARPLPRYCTVEEFDAKVLRYQELNEACGDLQATGADLVARVQGMLPIDLRVNAAIQIRADLQSSHALDDVDMAMPIFANLLRLDLMTHRQVVQQEAHMAQEALLAREAALAAKGGGTLPRVSPRPPGLGHGTAPRPGGPGLRDSRGGYKPTQLKRVKDMTADERRAALNAMSPCPVCRERHFGPSGWGRCAADPSVPLDDELRRKLPPGRLARVLAMRKGEVARVAREDSDDDVYESLEDMRPPAGGGGGAVAEDDAAQGGAGLSAQEDMLPSLSFETSSACDACDPYKEMLADMRSAGERQPPPAPVEEAHAVALARDAGEGRPNGVGARVATRVSWLWLASIVMVPLAVGAMAGVGRVLPRAQPLRAVALSGAPPSPPTARDVYAHASVAVEDAGPYDHGVRLDRLHNASPSVHLLGRSEHAMSSADLSPKYQGTIDSGATSVCLVLKEFFEQDAYTPLSDKYIVVANGAMVPIDGAGPARVRFTDVDGRARTHVFQRALHVSRFNTNLLSVDALWDNPGARVDVVFRDRNELIFQDGGRLRFGTRPKALRVEPSREVACAAEVSDMRMAHLRLMLAGEARVKAAVDVCTGLSKSLKHATLGPCDASLTANATRKPHNKKHAPDPGCFGWVSYDLAGPFPPTHGRRYRYLVVYTDLHTRLRHGYLLRSKDEVVSVTQRYLADVAPIGVVTRLHGDNAGENTSAAMHALADARSIRLTFSCPHTPQQNSTSERAFGTIFRHVRAALHVGRVAKSMWGYAALQAIDIMNRTLLVRDTGCTPWLLAFKTKADVSHLRPMFCKAYMKLAAPDKPSGAKVSDQAVAGLYCGRARSSPGDVVFVPEWNAERVSADVTYDERVYPGYGLQRSAPEVVDDAADAQVPRYGEFDTLSMDEEDMDGYHGATASSPAGEQPAPAAAEPPAGSPGMAPLTIAQRLQQARRANANARPNAFEAVFAVTPVEADVVDAALAAACAPSVVPAKHADVLRMGGADRERWLAAERAELDNHENNGTFRRKVALADLAPGAKVIKTTWGYKEKIGGDGAVSKSKARLSAQDLKRVWRFEGKHFESAFSNAMSLVGFRVLLALTAWTGNGLDQLDFTGAYLQKPVPEDKQIYVRPAPGYPVTVTNSRGESVEAVYELGKYIYGLQESGCEWQQHLRAHLVAHEGATASWVDPNLYYVDTPHGRMWIGVYVDDCLISWPRADVHEAFVQRLAQRFVFTPGGAASHFVGANIERVSKHVVRLSHTAYIRRMARVHGVHPTDCAAPCDVSIKKMVDELERTKATRTMDPDLVKTYRSIVGALLYCGCAVRADVAYPVNQLCRCLTYPDERALAAARRVLQYLAATEGAALEYDGSKGLDVDVFTDADWSVGPSTTGYMVRVGSGPVAWKSVRQRCITMSSCEAELVAANAAGAECVYVRRMLEDLVGVHLGEATMHGGFTGEMHCDNKATVAFVNTPVMTMGRLKHVERDYLKIREWVRDKLFSVAHVPTKRNLADIFTKAMAPPHFAKLRDMFMANVGCRA